MLAPPVEFLGALDAPVLVLVFVGNGCPSVRAFEPWLADFQRAYEDRGVQVVWVNSNNPALSPEDGELATEERIATMPYEFRYLRDPDHSLALALGAETTPHAFVLDEERAVRYAGAIGDSRQPDSMTTAYVQCAVDDLLAGRPVAVANTEPTGCAIVW